MATRLAWFMAQSPDRRNCIFLLGDRIRSRVGRKLSLMSFGRMTTTEDRCYRRVELMDCFEPVMAAISATAFSFLVIRRLRRTRKKAAMARIVPTFYPASLTVTGIIQSSFALWFLVQYIRLFQHFIGMRIWSRIFRTVKKHRYD